MSTTSTVSGDGPGGSYTWASSCFANFELMAGATKRAARGWLPARTGQQQYVCCFFLFCFSMKKVFGALAIVMGGVLAMGGLALVLWVVGRLTHAFDFYYAPTDSNAPTFRSGDRFFASRWATPQRLDFIVYHPVLPDDEQTVFVFRVCGLSGDTVELRHGRLFVNGQDLDTKLHLLHHYALARTDYARIPRSLFVDTTGIVPIGDSLYQVGLADADAARPALRAVRKVQPAGYLNPAITRRYPMSRNEDNFGPVIVPPSSYFVLGDNRQNAFDSRYAGWVSQSSVMGTVLGKH